MTYTMICQNRNGPGMQAQQQPGRKEAAGNGHTYPAATSRMALPV